MYFACLPSMASSAISKKRKVRARMICRLPMLLLGVKGLGSHFVACTVSLLRMLATCATDVGACA